MEYLIILMFVLLLSLFLEWKYHIHLYSSLKERITLNAIFFITGTLWDSIAVYRGHWSFVGSKGLVGWTIGVLPIEEYLFFLVVPYFILTVYKVIKKQKVK